MKKTCPQGISTVLILGIIAVLVTIVVPLVSRSVVDIRITQQQEEQSRAFSAAETGLDKALIGEPLEGEVGEDISYQVTATGKGGSDLFIYPKVLEKDFPITVWLMEHEGTEFDAGLPLDFTGDHYQGGTLGLFWGAVGTVDNSDQTPAIETVLFYQDNLGNYKTERYLFDPFVTRRAINNFQAPDTGGPYLVGSQQLQFTKSNISLPCDDGPNVYCYALRLRLLYSDNPHPVALEGNSEIIPRQGQCYESVATVQTSGITSRVQRCLFYKDFPAVFDFVLFSNYSLEKESL
ncbi:MAG TPA: hypothetical protein VMW41_03680 [Candidatus Bathyarchaeia archaeon]|nr:hypothetical protein [Candidatus Bathyarchaeia archaeon]